jgi:hypothetical protein
MTTQTWSAFAIAGSAFVLLGIGLVYCIMNLVRSNRQDILASVPLVTEQEISLAYAGEVLVAIETPRTSIDYRALQIQLIDKQTGHASTLSYSLVTAQGAVYGFTTMQVPFGRMNAQAGVYAARIVGLQPGKDYSNYRLIVSRPYMGRIVLQVLGIVFCGVGMLLSVIWAAWRAGWLKAAQI